MPNRTTGPRRGRHSQHFILTVDAWRGFQHGQKVLVLDSNGQYLPGYWEFMSYQVNLKTGKSWVTVFGGKPQYSSVRAVSPKSVVEKVDRRRKVG